MEGSTDLKIVFMGTAGFAVPSLEQLIENNLVPVAVVTSPDRRKGRGQKVQYTPIKEAAIRLGIERIIQPEDVKSPEFAEEMASIEPDIIVVVAFKILPPAVYTTAKLCAFNLHGSLLPLFRGAAPINRAVMAGATETGVTTFFLEQKVDTGNVILQRSMPIGEEESAGDVHDRMMVLGAEVVVETTKMIAEDRVETYQQDNTLATSAPKIFKEDCKIDWSQAAKDVHNHIRGLSPYPGAWTTHQGKQVKIYKSHVIEGEGDAGEIIDVDNRVQIACEEGALDILELQLESRKKMTASDFVRGYEIKKGDLFE